MNKISRSVPAIACLIAIAVAVFARSKPQEDGRGALVGNDCGDLALGRITALPNGLNEACQGHEGSGLKATFTAEGSECFMEGEPIYLKFTISNNGTRTIEFNLDEETLQSYRSTDY